MNRVLKINAALFVVSAVATLSFLACDITSSPGMNVSLLRMGPFVRDSEIVSKLFLCKWQCLLCMSDCSAKPGCWCHMRLY